MTWGDGDYHYIPTSKTSHKVDDCGLFDLFEVAFTLSALSNRIEREMDGSKIIMTVMQIMKNYWLMVLAMLACVTMTSCMKDEPLNKECDIEVVTLHVSNPEDYFFQLTDSTQNVISVDSVITFHVRKSADLTALVPELQITEGATVTPASGTVQDFSKGAVTYVVTSQDGTWQRRYQIAVVPMAVVVTDTLYYDFEDYELESSRQKYYVWHQYANDGTQMKDWASGNAGFKVSMSSAAPMDYPNIPIFDGYDGAGVEMITRDTGPFGRMAGKLLAAGSIFLGEFDVTNATRDPMHATRFGVPFTQKPVRFTGVYKYTPGETYQDKDGNVVENFTDSAAIYAIMYLNHDEDGNEVVLYGDNIQTSPQIVGYAKVAYAAPTTEWTPWDVEFRFIKPIDEELLANRGYNLSIVFSASKYGDIFEGAIGSDLCIDMVRLICTTEE